MRTYTLRCTLCRHVFDITMPLIEYISFVDTGMMYHTCPKCKKYMTPTRVITSTPVIYKGVGFYSTDNRKDKNESSI